ncbi:MFS transporter [Actinorugispora endophytica]|uniref:MFS transporter n=1 Tax=Actinorugispora endophytica TaxID=1605990 RepID=A0A4R6V682_9ACTN|nr:MFS transporter [Actinorugispora endophytica]TDQ54375.1 MFS transporter [Actinorugispora endophytica]
MTDPRSGRRAGPALAALLMLLTVFGPVSMDLYLPVLPTLTGELGAATSAAQFTLTACLIGLAVGQVIAGPLSDRFGRRTPLLVGVAAAYAASSLLGLARFGLGGSEAGLPLGVVTAASIALAVLAQSTLVGRERGPRPVVPSAQKSAVTVRQVTGE